jgi:hypothetical protein
VPDSIADPGSEFFHPGSRVKKISVQKGIGTVTLVPDIVTEINGFKHEDRVWPRSKPKIRSSLKNILKN